MRTHIQAVAVLNILWNFAAVATGLLCLTIGIGGGSALGLAVATDDAGAGAAIMAFLTAFGAIFGCAVMLPGLPGFIAGFALFNYRSWARVILIIVGAINLVNLALFPFSTALGIYTLYVLLHKDAEAIFANPDVDPDPIY